MFLFLFLQRYIAMFPAVLTLTALCKCLCLALISFLFQAQPILSLTVLWSQRYCTVRAERPLHLFLCAVKLSLCLL